MGNAAQHQAGILCCIMLLQKLAEEEYGRLLGQIHHWQKPTYCRGFGSSHLSTCEWHTGCNFMSFASILRRGQNIFIELSESQAACNNYNNIL